MKMRLASLLAASASLLGAAQAMAQAQPPGPKISQLLSQGYTLRAASSNGQQQFLYFQGADSAGRKTIYACQLQFGPNGAFQGCLELP
jgi:hypothetical protein